MLDDLKHSLRALRRTPVSSLSAICILAVAIGASAAVFTVVDKVLIRPLGLASFGVFATLSQSVVERTREIGIRVAVGALSRQVSALVVREGLALTAVGIVLGSAVASLAGGYLGRLLFEVPAIDAMTLAGMALLFSVVSAIAVYVPAWRAASLHPTTALRRQ